MYCISSMNEYTVVPFDQYTFCGSYLVNHTVQGLYCSDP